MQVTIEQLRQISLFSGLDLDQLIQLQTHAVVKQYLRGEIILHEGDRRRNRCNETWITVAIVFALLPDCPQHLDYV